MAKHSRYSSDRQHERSLEDQERNCRRFIEAQGWGLADGWIGTTTTSLVARAARA
jgi:hypothetical protein